MKKLLLVLFFVCMFSFPVSAEAACRGGNCKVANVKKVVKVVKVVKVFKIFRRR